GPDHAVARPDGRRRARDGTARAVAAAVDRRRDDVEAAHGGEDRTAVHTAGRPRARRLAGHSRRVGAPGSETAGGSRRPEPRAAGTAARSVRRARTEAAAPPRRGAREPRGGALRRPRDAGVPRRAPRRAAPPAPPGAP